MVFFSADTLIFQAVKTQIKSEHGHVELTDMFGSHSIDHLNKHDASSLKKPVLQSEVCIMQLVLIGLLTVQEDSASCNLCVTTAKEQILTLFFKKN